MEDAQLQEKCDSTMAWFSQFQLGCVIKNGVVPEWFHGIISRKSAEEILLSKPAGYFLIRVSESRIGFTLSYRAEDHCRHFMIDALKNGQYNIVGQNINHRSLQDLVAFHHNVPILPFNELLTVACVQVSKDSADYAELLSPQSKLVNPTTGVFSNNLLSTSNTNLHQLSSNMPPGPTQLPAGSCCGEPLQRGANTAVYYQRSPPALCPSLDAEQAKMTLQNSGRANSIMLQPAPELPSRLFPMNRNEQTGSGLIQVSSLTPLCGAAQPGLNCRSPSQQRKKGLKSAVANLLHLKRKPLTKQGEVEQEIYSELTESRVGQEPVSEPVYHEIPADGWIIKPETSHAHNTGVSGVLPGRLPDEYKMPPPFAPGY